MPAGELVTVQTSGFKELSERLRKLPLEIQKDGMGDALEAGGEVIADEASRLVARKRGKLASTIKVRVKVDEDVSEMEATISAGGKGAHHAHLLEFGTAPHQITPRVKKVLAAVKQGINSLTGATIFGRKVSHPGARAKPFMGPAYHTKKMEALNVIAKKLGEFLDKGGV